MAQVLLYLDVNGKKMFVNKVTQYATGEATLELTPSKIDAKVFESTQNIVSAFKTLPFDAKKWYVTFNNSEGTKNYYNVQLAGGYGLKENGTAFGSREEACKALTVAVRTSFWTNFNVVEE